MFFEDVGYAHQAEALSVGLCGVKRCEEVLFSGRGKAASVVGD